MTPCATTTHRREAHGLIGADGLAVPQVRGWRGIRSRLAGLVLATFGSDISEYQQPIIIPVCVQVFRLRRPHGKMGFVHKCYGLKS